MYFVQNNINLTTKSVLEQFSQEQIFSIVFGTNFSLNTKICSPFRGDTNPGCYFEYYNQKLWFIDFADIKIRRDCFEVVKDFYKLSFQDTLKFICSVLSTNSLTTAVKIEKYPEKLSQEERHFNIIFKRREFNQLDKEYWFPYKITREQLSNDKVFPIYWYKTQNFYKGDFIIRPFNITFAFTDFISGNIKIYNPLTKNKKSKWFTNCNENDIGNLNNIPKLGNTLIITKSYKDCRVIKNCDFPSIWLQNEVVIPKNSRNLYEAMLRFTNVYTLFDNDNTGQQFTKNFTLFYKEQFNLELKNLFIPVHLGKDPSEMQKNTKNLKELLINKIKK